VARGRELLACACCWRLCCWGLPWQKPIPVPDWNAIAVDTAVANGKNPFDQAGFAAIMQVAVFEAVNAITGDRRRFAATSVITLPHVSGPFRSPISIVDRCL
jgi:hypothetical protein